MTKRPESGARPTDTTPPDVLVHAGFHKTGTSALQAFLAANRTGLSEYFNYYGKADFSDAGARARRFGQRPFPWRLGHFRRGLRAFLAEVPNGHPLVLSRETFSGIMPGHRRIFRAVTSYGRAAPPLAAAIATELKYRFGPDVRIAFLYTTRARDSWLRSAYGHLLRSIALGDDFSEFRARISAPPHRDEVALIRQALGEIPVYTAALESHGKSPFGPANAVLDIMGVPPRGREGLIPVGRVNSGDPLGVSQEFLALNRSLRNKAKLRAEKDSILARERKSNG